MAEMKGKPKAAAVISFEGGRVSGISYEESLLGAKFEPYAVVVLPGRTPTASGYSPAENEAKGWVYSRHGLDEDALMAPRGLNVLLLRQGELVPLRSGPLRKPHPHADLSGVRGDYLPGVF